jgi:hypothetical protein
MEGRLASDAPVDLLQDVLDDVGGLGRVVRLVREGTKAAARNRRVAERVGQHPDEQAPRGVLGIDKVVVFLRSLAGPHCRCERVAVQQPVPLRLLHSGTQLLGSVTVVGLHGVGSVGKGWKGKHGVTSQTRMG